MAVTVVITAASGVIAQQGRPFTHGYEIYLEKATLLYDFAVLGGEPVLATPLTVLTQDGQVQRPELGSGDAITPFENELTEVVNAVQSNVPSPLLAGRWPAMRSSFARRKPRPWLRGRRSGSSSSEPTT